MYMYHTILTERAYLVTIGRVVSELDWRLASVLREILLHNRWSVRLPATHDDVISKLTTTTPNTILNIKGERMVQMLLIHHSLIRRESDGQPLRLATQLHDDVITLSVDLVREQVLARGGRAEASITTTDFYFESHCSFLVITAQLVIMLNLSLQSDAVQTQKRL